MRARIPQLNTAGDVPYRGGQPGRGPAELPSDVDPATLVIGQLQTFGELLERMQALLERTAEAGEADVTTIAAAAGLFTLADPKRGRTGLQIYNDSDTVLGVKLGAGASQNSLSFKLQPGQLYEMPKPVYKGILTGWMPGTPTGSIYVSEVV